MTAETAVVNARYGEMRPIAALPDNTRTEAAGMLIHRNDGDDLCDVFMTSRHARESDWTQIL
jgi:hypothetical protein